MRGEEFPETVKNQALKRANNKCERCWDSNDLEFHHKIPVILGGKSDLENCVVLCHNCHDVVPKDLVIFEEIFLRFSSVKEFCQHYNVNNEEKAIEKLCEERNLNKDEIIKKVKESKFSKADLIRERMTEKAKEGKILGFNIPYGYDYKDGKLIVNEKEAKVVKEIFRMYLERGSIRKIMKLLNEKNIPTKRKRKWRLGTIYGILKNPLYCGYLEWNGIIRKYEHAPIIDINTFNDVQKKIYYKTKDKINKKRLPKFLNKENNEQKLLLSVVQR